MKIVTKSVLIATALATVVMPVVASAGDVRPSAARVSVKASDVAAAPGTLRANALMKAKRSYLAQAEGDKKCEDSDGDGDCDGGLWIWDGNAWVIYAVGGAAALAVALDDSNSP